jgi:DNA-binding YbaB/EbfC family protein
MADGPDLNAMMQQAQLLQQRMLDAQEAARKKTVEASAGGGMVTVVVSGGMEVKSIKIDPTVIDPKDAGMLQDLIVAAVNQGILKAQELAASEMQSVTGGLNIPGLF